MSNPTPKMRKESDLSVFVYNQLKTYALGNDLLISESKNILTDVTCVFENKKFELIHGFAETDVCIYREIDFKYAPFKNNGLIKFYGDKIIKEGKFAIPYVVLELKTGNLTTDGIRNRDFVASRIKTMFPFTAYYLIAENTKKEEKTLLRQGKSFTNYFIIRDDLTKEKLKMIFETYIKPHIDNLSKQIKSSL
jgi:hypothetical protein